MNANTPAVRALVWMKAKHPELYRRLAETRPDIIRDATIKDLNGLGSVDGVLDDLLSFTKQAIPIYQQQKVFSTQLKQAAQSPTPQAATVIPAAPVNLAPYEAGRSRFTLASLGLLPMVAAVGFATYWLFFRKPGRAR